MFESVKAHDDFREAFIRISHGIASPCEINFYAAIRSGVNVIRSRYALFRQELDDVGELSGYLHDLDTFDHCLGVLQRYFDGNPGRLTAQDARIYNRYLLAEHNGFVLLANELAAGRG